MISFKRLFFNEISRFMIYWMNRSLLCYLQVYCIIRMSFKPNIKYISSTLAIYCIIYDVNM